MTTLDERVAYLEGKVEEHSRGFGELRDAIRQVDGHVRALDQKVDRLIAAVNGRIDALDQKIDRLIAGVSGRIDALDQKIDQGLSRLDDKLSRQFLWTVGIQVAVLLAVIGALARQ